MHLVDSCTALMVVGVDNNTALSCSPTAFTDLASFGLGFFSVFVDLLNGMFFCLGWKWNCYMVT